MDKAVLSYRSICIRTALAGYGGSSTRAEIAAGIIACQADVAVNIGSDSQAFVNKANYVANLVIQEKQPKRPWATQKDGDLWELLHETIKAKGPHTFLATKVKGHATDQMVADNEVKP